MASFLLRLDDDLHRRLRARSEAQGITMSDLARDALEGLLAAVDTTTCQHPHRVQLSGGDHCSVCGIRVR